MHLHPGQPLDIMTMIVCFFAFCCCVSAVVRYHRQMKINRRRY